MKTAAIIGIIVAVAIVIGVISMASTLPIESPEPDITSEAENNTGKFFKIELNESISAKAKP